MLAESYEHKDTLWDEYECPKFIPFNPVDKYTIAIIRDKRSGEMMRIMKGAPQVCFNVPMSLFSYTGLYASHTASLLTFKTR